jgi:hypothetical protein
MYAHQIADTHRQNLIAEASAYRLGRASREAAAEPRRSAPAFASRFRRVAFAR